MEQRCAENEALARCLCMKTSRTKESKAYQFISSPPRLYCSAGLGIYSSWFSMTKIKRALADIQEKSTPLCVLNKSSSSITARFTFSFFIYTRHPSVCYYNSSDPTSLHERKTCVSDGTNVLYWRKYGTVDSTAECTLTPFETHWMASIQRLIEVFCIQKFCGMATPHSFTYFSHIYAYVDIFAENVQRYASLTQDLHAYTRLILLWNWRTRFRCLSEQSSKISLRLHSTRKQNTSEVLTILPHFFTRRLKNCCKLSNGLL